jgi:hypothetical protein
MVLKKESNQEALEWCGKLSVEDRLAKFAATPLPTSEEVHRLRHRFGRRYRCRKAVLRAIRLQ